MVSSSNTSTTSNHTMSTANSQSLSIVLTVISANIEGLTVSKVSILSEMYKREHCHCLCLQETHRAPHLARPKIPGTTLISERSHIKYGSAILIRSDLKVVVVCLPRPMEGMGRLQFSDLFSQNCQFHHRRLESLEHLMCLIYILLSTTVSHFLDLTDAIFSSFFLYTFPFCKYTLHVCYVFNVNLTDSFDDRRSQCRLIE